MKKIITSLALVFVLFGAIAFSGCCGNPDEFANANTISQEDFKTYIENGKDGEQGTEDDLKSSFSGKNIHYFATMNDKTYIEVTILYEEGKIKEANIYLDESVDYFATEDEETSTGSIIRCYIKDNDVYYEIGETKSKSSVDSEDSTLSGILSMVEAVTNDEMIQQIISSLTTTDDLGEDFNAIYVENGSNVRFKVSGTAEGNTPIDCKLYYTDYDLTKCEVNQVWGEGEDAIYSYQLAEIYTGTTANLPDLTAWDAE